MKNKYVDKNKKHIEAFVERLKTQDRPEDFGEIWDLASNKVCGFYLSEAAAVWKIIRHENVRSIVEIGRNLGGGLVVLACAARKLEFIWSIDIVSIPCVDVPLTEWLHRHKINCLFTQSDSRLVYVPKAVPFTGQALWDFVYIDGEHTAEGVRADIEIWKDRCRMIAFHDYADHNRNYHRKRYPEVVCEINDARHRYGWEQLGKRGRSEVVFKTRWYDLKEAD